MYAGRYMQSHFVMCTVTVMHISWPAINNIVLEPLQDVHPLSHSSCSICKIKVRMINRREEIPLSAIIITTVQMPAQILSSQVMYVDNVHAISNSPSLYCVIRLSLVGRSLKSRLQLNYLQDLPSPIQYAAFSKSNQYHY